MKITKAILGLIIMAALLASCASGKNGSKGCGCNAKKGMVGY